MTRIIATWSTFSRAYVCDLSCGCTAVLDPRAVLHVPDQRAFTKAFEELERTHECQPKALQDPLRELAEQAKEK